MPPKRKNAPTSTVESPNKRVTRSRAIATPQVALEKPVRALPRKRGPKQVVEVDTDEEEINGEAEEPSTQSTRAVRSLTTRRRAATKTQPEASVSQRTEPPRRRGRPPTRKLVVDRERSPDIAQATSSKVTIEAMQDAADDSEPDELLLVPMKKVPARPTTPPRRTGTVVTTNTSRMVLDAVEVPSPSKKMREIQNIVSPKVTSPIKFPASPVKQFPQRETTPTRPVAGAQSSPKRLARARPSSPPEDTVFPPSPSKLPPVTPTKSPRKGLGVVAPQTSPGRLPRLLPPHLRGNLDAQKRVTLKALHEISVLPHEAIAYQDGTERSTNTVAYDQLSGLLKGTVERSEGNSCLIIGPKGSGKTQLVERAISSLSESPVVIRLSGHAQTNDRLAIREIAWQLAEQTGQALLPTDNDEAAQDEENPFIQTTIDTVVTLPPPSHLLALISMLPTLPRPTLVILDAFDLFALHARQSLLYCLLDTVQSCRAIPGNKGIAVVGVTTRVETINILEKRVKSRFSGRIIRTAGLPQLTNWIEAIRSALCSPIDNEEADWSAMWENSVDRFLQDPQVVGLLKETYSITKDVRVFSRLLTSIVAALKPSSPILSLSELTTAVNSQRCPARFSFLSSLTYPSLCLLIAAMHTRTSGHETFTFEMLHEAFRDQVRISLSAPVTVDGGGIGMVRCSREVLFGAFEKLASLRVFVTASSAAAGTGREFIKYRCDVDRAEVKGAVDKTGQLNLKKWLNKAQ